GTSSNRNPAVSSSVTVTVTAKLPLELLPDESLAVHSTTDSPGGNTDPDSGTHHTTGIASSASVAVTSNSTRAPSAPVASNTMSPGRARAGGVLSRQNGSSHRNTFKPPLVASR